jgi:hypothetical protein
VSSASSLDSKNFVGTVKKGVICGLRPQLKKMRTNAPAAFDYQASTAIAEACEKASQSMHDWGQPDAITKMVAKRIIELASKGERNPDQLCDQALKSFGFSESPSLQPRASDL